MSNPNTDRANRVTESDYLSPAQVDLIAAISNIRELAQRIRAMPDDLPAAVAPLLVKSSNFEFAVALEEERQRPSPPSEKATLETKLAELCLELPKRQTLVLVERGAGWAREFVELTYRARLLEQKLEGIRLVLLEKSPADFGPIDKILQERAPDAIGAWKWKSVFRDFLRRLESDPSARLDL